jgi:hypothetical protein
MKPPGLIRKHRRIHEEKGLLRRRDRPDDIRPASPPKHREACGGPLQPKLAPVCSGVCYEQKPE